MRPPQPATEGAMAALSIEEVLADEVEIIHGEKLAAKANSQDAQDKRKNLNSDKRGLIGRHGEDVQPRHEFYVALNRLNRAALCCSGGGIRSATFCLGVIQALANCDVDKGASRAKSAAAAQHTDPETADHLSAKTAASKPEVEQPMDPKNSALGRFHYLSTVSGGGYVGSWLSSWRHRSDFATVIGDLTGRPNGPDIEPPEISWLRAYSNYLTPKLGIASADSWAAVAISARNLILNWLVIIPIVCLALLVLKLIATVSVWTAHTVVNPNIMIGIALIGALLLVVAQAFTNRHRPARRAEGVNPDEWAFLKCDFLLAFASATLVTLFFSSYAFWSGYEDWVSAIAKWPGLAAILDRLGFDLKLKFLLMTAVGGMVLYAAGWIAAFRFGKGGRDFIGWAVSGLVYGALVGLGAYLFLMLKPYPATKDNISCLLVSVILGVPWVMMAQLAAEIVFVGLSSDEDGADADREWLGRAAGWLAAGAIVWGVAAFLVFAGGYLVQYAAALGHQTLVKAGGVAGVVSGLLTAYLGGSSKTPAKSSSKEQGGVTATASNVGLALAGPIFVAVLIVVLSASLDKLLFADALAAKLQLIKDTASTYVILLWLGIGLLITAIIAWVASRTVNVNRFSLHALYRNRLIRCYLGASNEKRDPDLFSGLDFNDNVCVHEIWPPKSGGKINPHSLFHVVNIALNVVSTKRLAWQQRKAESFTVSPRHCGSAYLGFRKSQEYGGQGGLSLGTAMAISGAAVSPNMGYHSSPSIALLLTLFNVRLGWWLGNPGKAGDKTYTEDGPSFAAKPLFEEAFGQTTDDSPYVYLSDGGHFENLALYEMVRRRCRLIVLIDAGCDPNFAFEDLGNAVRKIYIDLGIRITFAGLEGLRNHPSPHPLSSAVLDAAARVNKEVAKVAKAAAQAARAMANAVEHDAKDDETAKPDEIPYHAIGTIHYDAADRGADDHGAKVENGHILYIKPAYHGTEGAGIMSYATANPDFPHESTAEQWFTESQLESYRSLGLDVGNAIFGREIVLSAKPKLTLHDALKALKVRT
jgi:hypothetical protein